MNLVLFLSWVNDFAMRVLWWQKYWESGKHPVDEEDNIYSTNKLRKNLNSKERICILLTHTTYRSHLLHIADRFFL